MATTAYTTRHIHMAPATAGADPNAHMIEVDQEAITRRHKWITGELVSNDPRVLVRLKLVDQHLIIWSQANHMQRLQKEVDELKAQLNLEQKKNSDYAQLLHQAQMNQMMVNFAHSELQAQFEFLKQRHEAVLATNDELYRKLGFRDAETARRAPFMRDSEDLWDVGVVVEKE